jgi:hypothetical protein
MNKYLILFIFLGIFFVGCSRNVKVSGTVTYMDGTPVQHGSVVFDAPGYQASGQLSENGQYVLSEIKPGDGIKAGSYKVRIAGASTGGDSDGNPLVRYVDPKYTDSETSGLTAEVSGGKKTFNFQVEKFKE